MELLEREAFLESLEGHLTTARDGGGCLVLVGGEAGIGKTALVRAFCDRHATDARVLGAPATRSGPRGRSARCSTSPARPAGSWPAWSPPSRPGIACSARSLTCSSSPAAAWPPRRRWWS